MSFTKALTRRVLPFAYLALLAATFARSLRRCLVVGGVVLATAFLSTGLSWLTLGTLPSFSSQYRIELPPNAKLIFRATLSSFPDMLSTGASEEDNLSFYIPLQNYIALSHSTWETQSPKAVAVSVVAGSTPIPVEHDGKADAQIWGVIDTAAAIQALSESPELVVELTNQSARPLFIAGWQGRGLPGRQVDLVSPTGHTLRVPSAVPAVEIRLLRPDRSLKLAGF